MSRPDFDVLGHALRNRDKVHQCFSDDQAEMAYRWAFDLHVGACAQYLQLRERARADDQGQCDLFGSSDAEVDFWSDLCDALELERYRARDQVVLVQCLAEALA